MPSYGGGPMTSYAIMRRGAYAIIRSVYRFAPRRPSLRGNGPKALQGRAKTHHEIRWLVHSNQMLVFPDDIQR